MAATPPPGATGNPSSEYYFRYPGLRFYPAVGVFPQGRDWLTNRPQAAVLDAFGAFLAALDARPDAFPAAVRQKGRTLHASLRGALQAAAATDTGRDDLHDGRETTCRQPQRVAAFLI